MAKHYANNRWAETASLVSRFVLWLFFAFATAILVELGFDTIGIIDRLFGVGSRQQFVNQLASGESPWIMVGITAALGLAALALAVVFLYEPLAEFVRRIRSPNRIYFRSKLLANDMRELSKEILQELSTWDSEVPFAGDNLNYVGHDVKGVVAHGPEARSGLVIGPESSGSDMVRMFKGLQSDRRNHEMKCIADFQSEFNGKVRAYLVDCCGRGLIANNKEQAIVDMTLGDPTGRALHFYREQATLLSTCAERLST